MGELPGGEVKARESHPAALRRIFRELLGVEIIVGEPLGKVEHAYTHFTLTLHVRRVGAAAGAPQARFHQALRRVTPRQRQGLASPLADRKILRSLE